MNWDSIRHSSTYCIARNNKEEKGAEGKLYAVNSFIAFGSIFFPALPPYPDP